MTPANLQILAMALSVIGVATAAIGAFIAVRAIWLAGREAVDIAIPRWAGAYEENLRLQSVQTVPRPRRSAQMGFWIVAAGGALHIVGAVISSGIG